MKAKIHLKNLSDLLGEQNLDNLLVYLNEILRCTQDDKRIARNPFETPSDKASPSGGG